MGNDRKGGGIVTAAVGQAAAQLRDAERDYQAALRHAEQARDDREAAVRAAVGAGISQAECGRILGLGRARIGQIIGGERNATTR
jgi:hypothetical protein